VKRLAIGVGIAIGLYTVIGFFVCPGDHQVSNAQAAARVDASARRRPGVKLNPYALSFTLRGFSLTEMNGDEFVSLGELYVNFESISLLKRGFVFKEISVKKPSRTSSACWMGRSTSPTC